MITKDLLYAKDAIFKLIAQFHCPSRSIDGELYIYDYCESALEAAFNILGIEEDYIKLIEFCQMWEDNDRAIWKINKPDDFKGITADIRYEFLKKDFECLEKQIYEEDD